MNKCQSCWHFKQSSQFFTDVVPVKQCCCLHVSLLLLYLRCTAAAMLFTPASYYLLCIKYIPNVTNSLFSQNQMSSACNTQEISNLRPLVVVITNNNATKEGSRAMLSKGDRVWGQEVVGEDGWVNKTSDFNMGDCCLFLILLYDRQWWIFLA